MAEIKNNFNNALNNNILTCTLHLVTNNLS